MERYRRGRALGPGRARRREGVQVTEIVLSRAVRGAGLGVAVQRRFAEHVASREPDATIWGTVTHVNLPMRRTAERAGRIDIGSDYLIDL